MTSRKTLIDDLAGQLQPVPPAPDPRLLAGAWLLASAVYVVLLTHLLGPLRPTALAQLQTEPRFLLEMVLGVVAVAMLAVSALYSAVPGALGPVLRRVAVIAGGLWVGTFVISLGAPALEPSMVGKRDHCYLETLFYALPPMLVALYLQQRLYPLRGMLSAVLAGVAAGSLPALYMQVACMYLPVHGLLFHLGPGLAMGLAGALALVLYRRLALSRGSAETG